MINFIPKKLVGILKQHVPYFTGLTNNNLGQFLCPCIITLFLFEPIFLGPLRTILYVYHYPPYLDGRHPSHTGIGGAFQRRGGVG